VFARRPRQRQRWLSTDARLTSVTADVGPALVAAAERILASAEPWPSAKRRAIRRVVDFYTATGDVQHAAAWRSKLASAPSPSS